MEMPWHFPDVARRKTEPSGTAPCDDPLTQRMKHLVHAREDHCACSYVAGVEIVAYPYYASCVASGRAADVDGVREGLRMVSVET